jgi:TolB-like protein/predicted Ser/Thr protein kinase
MRLHPGARLGPYEITAPLGEGGMGEVYKARDVRLNRPVAIKILRAEIASNPDRVERFEREAQAASALNHPNIVTIHDVGREGDASYIAMEWVAGRTLRDLLTTGALPVRRVTEIARQVAEGLAKAHAAGIVHRDLKPENVMVTDDGLVKIVDFGLARLGGAAAPDLSQLATSPGTAAGVVMGTAGYMSPEQASGRVADYPSDQFALGLMVYEALTATKPFARATAAQTLVATIEVDPAPVASLNAEVAPDLARIIHRCLEKDPANRYASTRDLAHDLRDAGGSSSASASAGVAVASAPASRRRTLAIGAAAVVIAAAAVGAWMTWGRAPSDGGSGPLVAVRPFRNLSQDPAQSYFTDGVTDEIRGQLSKIAALRVLSRAAVEKYRDDEGPRLVREFGVDHVVDGSVRLDGKRVRISVELIDARTQQARWSEQYERELADVLSVQNDVALRVARTLAATLSPAERERVEKLPTQNVDAYQLYLRAKALRTLAERERNLQAIDLLNQALALDPGFALARAAMSYRVFFRAYGEDPKFADDAIRIALEAAASDPALADPHMTLGSAYGLKGRIPQARAAFLRALELNPNHTSSMVNLSFTESLAGQLDESLYWARRSFPLSAKNANDYYHVTVPLLLLRDDGLTRRWLSDAERNTPYFYRTDMTLAALDVQTGGSAAGVARLRAVAEKAPGNLELSVLLCDLLVITGAADVEAAVERMFRASPDIPGVVLPETGRLRYAYFLGKRGDPRAAALLNEAASRARQKIEAGELSASTFVELAAARALQGDPKGALADLQRAFDNGWRDYGFLQVDPMLASLAGEPGFRALVDRMTADVAAQRARAIERGLLNLEGLIGRPLP